MRFLYLSVAALLLVTSDAVAKTKSFVINGPDLKAAVGGPISEGVETVEGLVLGDGGFGRVVVIFTLPKDYKKNTPVTITLRMFGGGSSCNVYLAPDVVLRYRNDKIKTTGGGLTANAPVPFARPADFNLIQSRSYTLRKVGSGPLPVGNITDQLPGDGIAAFFMRHGQADQDTCTNVLIINSAKITYTVK